MEIRFVTQIEDAQSALAEGYIPIECSFGHFGSVVDPVYCMDHHGAYSHLEGVALRAYRDFFGALKNEPQKFVVTGAADADACFAIASLIGALPSPDKQNLLPLAEHINEMDTDPICVLLGSKEGNVSDYVVQLLLWNQLGSGYQDAISFHAGVDRWRSILERNPTALLEAAKQGEKDRIEAAIHVPCQVYSKKVAFVESDLWGFDVWYGWYAPCVVAYTPKGNVTLGCKDIPTAEQLFGPGGLKNVFIKLQPDGWGGREAIGGSPRGMVLTREQALAAADLVAASIR